MSLGFHAELFRRELRAGKSLYVLCDDTIYGRHSDRSIKTPNLFPDRFPTFDQPTREDVLAYLREMEIADCFRDVCLVHADLTRNLYGIEEPIEEFPDYVMITVRHLLDSINGFNLESISSLGNMPKIGKEAVENTRKLKERLVQDAQPRNGRYDRLFIVDYHIQSELYDMLENVPLPVQPLSFWEMDL